MSANPIDSTNTDKPTGSLEDLFRHHLAEAAVPPRPMVWEQIDNSLLQHQNAQYRRRLSATRWVAAASIAIAALAGTGWWATHDTLQHDRADLAAATHRIEVAEAGQRQQAPGRSGTSSAAPSSELAATAATAGRPAQSSATNLAQSSYAANDAAASASRAATQVSGTTAASLARSGRTAHQPLVAANALMARQNASHSNQFSQQNEAAARSTAALAANTGPASAPRMHEQATGATVATSGAALAGTQSGTGVNAGIEGLTSPAARNAVAATVAGTAASAAGSRYTGQPNDVAASLRDTQMSEELALLASRTAALTLMTPSALPTGFATVEVPADGTPPAVTPTRNWQFGASYVAGVFNPNINFSRAGGDAEFDYNPALGPNSPALSEAAAAEYRENLRPGFSQRLALKATRRLGGRLSLSTGVEVAQSRASSASSLAFVGEQVPDFGQQVGGPMRTTNFRYQTASIPVELRYACPVKRGLSLYGRVGAAVSALLGVRAEVEGIPEATRSYSIAAEGPYRRVLTNLRTGVGAQYRPTTGHWTVSLGPTAEVGLMSLNAHPAQGLAGQSRAYSLGLEAGVEFGRVAK